MDISGRRGRHVFGALLARHIEGLHRIEHWGMLAVVMLAPITHLAARRRRRKKQ
jgi:hypothetical protein